MNHTTEKDVLKSMGDSSLNIYILGNAKSKAVWFPSTINTVELQGEKKERNYVFLYNKSPKPMV